MPPFWHIEQRSFSFLYIYFCHPFYEIKVNIWHCLNLACRLIIDVYIEQFLISGWISFSKCRQCFSTSERIQFASLLRSRRKQYYFSICFLHIFNFSFACIRSLTTISNQSVFTTNPQCDIKDLNIIWKFWSVFVFYFVNFLYFWPISIKMSVLQISADTFWLV